MGTQQVRRRSLSVQKRKSETGGRVQRSRRRRSSPKPKTASQQTRVGTSQTTWSWASAESMNEDRERPSPKRQSGPCSVVVLSSETIPNGPFTAPEGG